MSGWIKLYRKTLKSDMYKSLNSKQRDVMMTLLMMVNHKEKEWEWNGQIFKTKPGQVVTSIAKIKENCASDVSLQSVRTALLKLEKWGFLTNESTKTGRLITIVNWGVYQDGEDQTNKENNKELTKHQQRTNKELTTNKNDKNDKNVKNDKEEVVVAADNPFRFFEENGFGTLSPFLVDEINHWIDGDYFDEPEKIIIEALKESLRANVRRWIYANKILMEWSNQKLRTLNDVKAHIKARNNVVPLKKEKSSYEKMQEAARAEWAKTDKLMAELRAEIRRRQRLQQANGG